MAGFKDSQVLLSLLLRVCIFAVDTSSRPNMQGQGKIVRQRWGGDAVGGLES